MSFKHGTWSSQNMFLFAAIGAAVGLGNIWRFPYMAGTNGGGAFVLIYLLAVALIAIPALIAETMIGRNINMSPPVAMTKTALESNASPLWGIVGWLGVAAAFLILSFYSVICGWVFAYIPAAFTAVFENWNSESSSTYFNEIIGNPITSVFWHTIFLILTASIVYRGIKSGLEKAVKVMMPTFFVLLVIICIYAAVIGNLLEGFRFLFAPDLSKINDEVILAAIGQAFFSIGVGMGIMFTYGAYLPKNIPLPRACVMIAVADTLVAIIAGLAIFPIVFHSNLDPASGPGLVFITLPIAFGQMNGGLLIGGVFYILLAFAALTSAISLLEVPVSWLVERKGWSRQSATITMGTTIWLFGISSALSTNIWSEVYLLGFIERFKTMQILDLVDYFTGQFLLPVGGMLVTLFAGWVIKSASLKQELNLRGFYFKVWRFLVRFICPIGILLVLVSAWS